MGICNDKKNIIFDLFVFISGLMFCIFVRIRKKVKLIFINVFCS